MITKKQAIRYFRAHWKKIYKEYKNGNIKSVADLLDMKSQTLPANKNIDNDCWLCHYMYEHAPDCSSCPVIWHNRSTSCSWSYYGDLMDALRNGNHTRADKLFQTIINLKERD